MYYMLNLWKGGLLIVSELGVFLRKLRGGLSLREAAKRSGLSYTYIRSLELGKHPRTGSPINPTPDILRGLAKAYNYPHEELMRKAGYLDKEIKNDIYKEETQLDKDKKYALELIMGITDPDKQKAAIEYLKYLAGEK
jgi:transcriptional regulator with XRE-family HTH domain